MKRHIIIIFLIFSIALAGRSYAEELQNPEAPRGPADHRRSLDHERRQHKRDIRRSPNQNPEAPKNPKPVQKPRVTPNKNEGEGLLIQLDFTDTPITTVIEMISKHVNKNFVFDEKVRGNITIISPKKVTPDEAYKVLLTLLEMKGFSVVESGKLVKIIPKNVAKSSSIDTRTKVDGIDPVDNFITQLVPLIYANAMTMQNGIRQIISRDGVVFAYEDSNTLVIIDTAANIERVLKITKELDVEGVRSIYDVIQIKYALSADIVKELSSIFLGSRRVHPGGKAPAAASQVQVKMISDDRTNSIIVFADKRTLNEIKEIIAKLDISDVSVPKGQQSKISVYYLKYANAEDIAEVLVKFSSEAKKRTSANRARPKTPPTVPGQKTPLTPPAKSVQAGKLTIEGDVTITSDKATNSLIILASPSDYEVIKGVIEKLDIMRSQVFVEAFIVEISLDKERELGVEWRSTADFSEGGTSVIGGTNFGTINNVAANPLAAPSGLVIGAVDGTISFGGKEFVNVGALIRALEVDSEINVMSRPHILTMDNEEAEINVVENIPYKTGEKFDTNGNPVFSFSYKDVGLILKLTPQVMESNFVKLNISQEISQLVKSTRGIEATAPTTSKRLAKTTVFVKDKEMVVIGGLIKDNEVDSVSKVPCLGDIPVLGALFRAKSTKNQKTDLLIFLTPHIIRDYSDLKGLSDNKEEEMETFKETEEFESFKRFKKNKKKFIVEDDEADE
jgi:general secretion pathway protein D